MACPKLSIADKTYIQQRDQPRVNAVLVEDSTESLADVYGYKDIDTEQLQQEEQVRQQLSINTQQATSQLHHQLIFILIFLGIQLQ